jgi:phosphoribosyl 1,2-cyclic phosphate phosphodiesterase
VTKLRALKITFLGTGTSQGIPIIGSDHPVCLSKNPKDKRLRVSVLIEWNGFSYVIDCGPDFRQQMLRVNCKHLDGILLTHEHNDHVAGIDDVRPFFFRQGDMPMYASYRVFESLKKRFDYIFTNGKKYPGVPNFIEKIIDTTPFELAGKTIIPVEVMHGNLPVLGFRIDNFAYLTDVKTIAAQELKKLENLEVLVISTIRHKPHHSHLNLNEALTLIQQIKPKKTYLTHISHLLGFHDEVENALPKNIFLAYDGLVLDL